MTTAELFGHRKRQRSRCLGRSSDGSKAFQGKIESTAAENLILLALKSGQKWVLLSYLNKDRPEWSKSHWIPAENGQHWPLEAETESNRIQYHLFPYSIYKRCAELHWWDAFLLRYIHTPTHLPTVGT